MTSYGNIGPGFSTFSDNEKLNYSLKIALARVQTDLKKKWFVEPNDFIPQFPEYLYKNTLPDYFDIYDYLLIDPDFDNNGNEKVTNISVENILQSSSKGSQFTLSDILDTTKVRNPEVTLPPPPPPPTTSNVPTYVSGTSNSQVEKLGRNMFTRYKYWQNHLTGKESTWSTTDKSDILNTHLDGTGISGTHPTSSPDTEPNNAYITLNNTIDSSNPHLNNINSNRTFKNIDANSTFYEKLKSHSVPISIISSKAKNSDGSFDLSKKHPFLKLYLQLPLYSTFDNSIGYKINANDNDESKSDNIAFTNPVLFKALGDKEKYQYRIIGYDGGKWNNITTSLGDDGNKNILYFLNNPGFVISFGTQQPINGNLISARYPPAISFIKYTGETFADGIISQSAALPVIANDKDLFIDTSENTIYRFDASANPGMSIDATGPSGEWISIGGGNTDLSNYYTKPQVYAKTESDDKFQTKINNTTDIELRNLTIKGSLSYAPFNTLSGKIDDNVGTIDTNTLNISANTIKITDLSTKVAENKIVINNKQDKIIEDTDISLNDLTVYGNLTVNKLNYETQNINTTYKNSIINDNIITLGADINNNINSYDTGFIFVDNNNSKSNKTIFWSQSENRFVFGKTDSSGIAINDNTMNVNLSEKVNIAVKDISANDASFNNVDIDGKLNVKDISANDASFNNVDISGILRINNNPLNFIAYNEYGLTIEGKTQGSVDISINKVTKIIFDNGTGFNVDLSGTTTAKITLGSHWKTIDISANGGEIATDSSSSLVPSGEETLQIIAGENIILQGKIGSPPTISQSLKISAKTPTLKELGIDVSANKINFLSDVSDNIQHQFTSISTRVDGFSGTKIGIINSPPSGNATAGDAKFNTDNDVLYVNVDGNSWRPIIGGTDNSKYHPSNAPVQLLLPIIEQMKDFMETIEFANNKKQTLLNILTQQPETFTLDASYNKGDYISDASNVILRWNYDDIMIHQDTSSNLTNQLSLFDKATNIPNIDEIFIDISGSMTDNSWNEIKRFSVDDYNTDEFKTFTIKNNESHKYSRRVYNSFLKGDKFQIGIYGKNNAKNYRLKEDRMLIFDCSFANTNDVSYNINTFQITIADLSGNIGNLNFTKNAENNAVLLKKVHHADMSGNWMKPYDLSGVKTGTQSYKWMTFKIDKNSFYIKTAKHKSASTTINYIDVPLFMKHEGFTNTQINHFGNNTSFMDSSGIVGFIIINALDYNNTSKSKVCHFMKNTRTNPIQIWYAGLNPSDISLSHLLDETNGKYYGGLVDTGNYIVDNWGIQCPRLHKFTSDIYLVIGIKI